MKTQQVTNRILEIFIDFQDDKITTDQLNDRINDVIDPIVVKNEQLNKELVKFYK